MTLFEGFERARIDTGEAIINLVHRGKGPPLLLLHGYPQTHVCWHKVAPHLTDRFTLIIPDLRGYGDSKGPEPDEDHLGYCKRAMARDMLHVMERFGYYHFALAGHDRGGRVAYRLALDHPDRVQRLAVLDIVPTLELAEMTSYGLALAIYHWFFLAQPHPLPETLIGHAPDFYLRRTVRSWTGIEGSIDPAAMAEYERCFRNPSVIRAACEDYRAGLSIDLEHDRADRTSGRCIHCPLLVLWGARGILSEIYNPVSIWQRWADDARGSPLPFGHFLMEEAPLETAKALADFFG